MIFCSEECVPATRLVELVVNETLLAFRDATMASQHPEYTSLSVRVSYEAIFQISEELVVILGRWVFHSIDSVLTAIF